MSQQNGNVRCGSQKAEVDLKVRKTQKLRFTELETASEFVLERIVQLAMYQVWSRLLSWKMMLHTKDMLKCVEGTCI